MFLANEKSLCSVNSTELSLPPEISKAPTDSQKATEATEELYPNTMITEFRKRTCPASVSDDVIPVVEALPHPHEDTLKFFSGSIPTGIMRSQKF